jgi:hypothetical protein
VYVTEESGVVGLNFHQSKEVLITDSSNGLNHYEVYTPVMVLYCVAKDNVIQLFCSKYFLSLCNTETNRAFRTEIVSALIIENTQFQVTLFLFSSLLHCNPKFLPDLFTFIAILY